MIPPPEGGGMTIRLLFFAELRDLFGASEGQLELVTGTTVEEAFKRWQALSHYPVPAELPVRFAVNEWYAEPTRMLENGDCLAVLTPVSGG